MRTNVRTLVEEGRLREKQVAAHAFGDAGYRMNWGDDVRTTARAHMREMVAQNRSWEALVDNIKLLGIDLDKGRPQIVSIQGERL